MNISMICFSLTGENTAKKLEEGLVSRGYQVWLYRKSRYLSDSISLSTREWAGECFQKEDGIIFVGACGIAVRSIAPYIVSKKFDPAVLVVDECGKYAISLLSGHLGGANLLTEEVSEILGAQAVITTATDLHDQFSVDVFAKANGCELPDLKMAKNVSAAILAGEKVGFYSEFPTEGSLPNGLVLCDEGGIPLSGQEKKEPMKRGIVVTIRQGCRPFSENCPVVPGAVVLGLGCKKGKEAEIIRQAVKNCLRDGDVSPLALSKVCSIDLKKEEPGILAFVQELGIPFETYSGEELMDVAGKFTKSEFVKKVTGVDNVCERSAVLGSSLGEIIGKKTCFEGVTTALALKKWRIRFE